MCEKQKHKVDCQKFKSQCGDTKNLILLFNKNSISNLKAKLRKIL
ncbi:hypothetical protein UNSW2_250 [Campylobacter concisus UNSW2]|uniref:Uncharacterized protein n=1 Tax=Campylobacter concisus UNSW2 TaxID=1242965 RepID=U2FMP2_9BACT|nr:hypothetical protein UNSW2_250 [Campylobacter concisus UNSW2]